MLLVDNASSTPVASIPVPEQLDVRHLRLEENRGGSGGFSRGLESWLASGVRGDPHELLWLLDSDVRLDPGALLPLVRTLAQHPELAGTGSALAEPDTGVVFEVGGEVDPSNGELVQSVPADWARREVIPAGYIAACSLLVRRTAVEAAGVMADLFISGDDVEWCYRITRRTGLGFAVTTASHAFHPHPDKMRTTGRYYAARNASQAMAAAGVTGRMPRFRRSLREIGRAVSQVMVGRDDLAALHLRGLRDARLGVRGPATGLVVAPARPLSELDAAIKEALADVRGRVMLRPDLLGDPSALLKSLNAVCVAPDTTRPVPVTGVPGTAWALISGVLRVPEYGVAVVSARGRPEDWLAGKVTISVGPDGFYIYKVRRFQRLMRLLGIVAGGMVESARVAMVPVQAAETDGRVAAPSSGTVIPTLSIVILSYNRWAALQQTLGALAEDPAAKDAQIIVVDNGSMDGTQERLRSKFPSVKLVGLRSNAGVAGFNEGVRASSGQAVLILDDDARPAPGALAAALECLGRRPDIAAIPLHPHHPQSQRSEWSFAGRAGAEPGLQDQWPVMGCANIIRRTAWDRVGGYEESFFLYRNDVDLALKLMDAGYRVHFDPKWIVWHDSPATARKSVNWFKLATRNWIWLCRRHGRGHRRYLAMATGWLWAHRLAGLSPGAHLAAVRGGLSGVLSRSPRKPMPCVRGTALAAYLKARFARG